MGDLLGQILVWFPGSERLSGGAGCYAKQFMKRANRENPQDAERAHPFQFLIHRPLCACVGEGVRVFSHARCIDGVGTGVGGFLRVPFISEFKRASWIEL